MAGISREGKRGGEGERYHLLFPIGHSGKSGLYGHTGSGIRYPHCLLLSAVIFTLAFLFVSFRYRRFANLRRFVGQQFIFFLWFLLCCCSSHGTAIHGWTRPDGENGVFNPLLYRFAALSALEVIWRLLALPLCWDLLEVGFCLAHGDPERCHALFIVLVGLAGWAGCANRRWCDAARGGHRWSRGIGRVLMDR